MGNERLSQGFHAAVRQSFLTMLRAGTRSTDKLIPLHGRINSDIQASLSARYTVRGKGVADGREVTVQGRYYAKDVDIVVELNQRPVAGIAVKFAASNFAQNANNYFESMLGETANLRATGFSYFQVFVLPRIIPYYNKQDEVGRIETVSASHLSKYVRLSRGDPATHLHMPVKTLLYLVDVVPALPEHCRSRATIKQFYLDNEPRVAIDASLRRDDPECGPGVLLNNYPQFIDAVSQHILQR